MLDVIRVLPDISVNSRRAVRVATALALVFCVAGTVHAEERLFEQTLETSEGVVELVVVNGTSTTLHITTGAPGQVVVEGTVTGFPPRWGRRRAREQIDALAASPPIKQDGNTVRVEALPWRVRRDLSFSYRFVVPPNTNIRAYGSIAVHVEGLIGNLHVSGGRTFAAAVQGDVTLERAEVVHVEDLTGDLHVTGGKIVASRVSGDVVLVRAESVQLDAVGENVTVTDRATTVGLDDVVVDLGTFVD